MGKTFRKHNDWDDYNEYNHDQKLRRRQEQRRLKEKQHDPEYGNASDEDTTE